MCVRIMIGMAGLAAIRATAGHAETSDVEIGDCGSPVAVGKTLVTQIKQDGTFSGFPLAGGRALLIGTLDGIGTIAFVRDGSQWRGYAVEARAAPVGLFRSKRSGSAFLFTMHTAEGPGSSFTSFAVPGKRGVPACGTIEFPGSLNQPTYTLEYLALRDFNIRADGRGALIGAALVNRDGQEQTWRFRYTTRDYGRSWSDPVRIETAAAPPGAFKAVEGAPDRLVNDLIRSAQN